MPIREDIKDRVQQATDIVRLIGEQVALRPKGKEFAGLCPFHDDKNPSMQVSPAKQIYKCFSCGAGGDVFSFVMNYHKMTFPEAIKHLAERAGIEVEEDTRFREKGDGPSERDKLRQANGQALEFFRALLKHSEHGNEARAYIERRGINPEMVAEFQIGYAPDGWDKLVQMIEHSHWPREGFELAGLISQRDSGGFYDRLRHRLIFPIFDAIGRPIAFGGRKLREEDEPKYLNSPETKLFNKSATLYGLNLAKKPIIDSKTAVIVEGYTDVIACHQYGARNVVATLGTALTAEHVRELRRYAEKVVLIFDGDEAGQKAADRAVELFLTGDLDVYIAILPDGLDPADFVAQQEGKQRWDEAIDSAQDALSYQFARLSEQLDDTTTLTGRQNLADGYMTRLAQLGLTKAGSIRRALVIQRLSEIMHMPEQAVGDLLSSKAKTVRRTPSTPTATPPPTPAPMSSEEAEYLSESGQASEDGLLPDSDDQSFAPADSGRKLKALALAERQIIGCLIRDNQRFVNVLIDGRPFDEAVTTSDFISRDNKLLFERLHDRLANGQTLTLAGMLGDLAFNSEQHLADQLTEADAEVEARSGGKCKLEDELLVTAVHALHQHQREHAYRQTKQALNNEGNKGSEETDATLLIKQMIEHRRDNPSPVRIARARP